MNLNIYILVLKNFTYIRRKKKLNNTVTVMRVMIVYYIKYRFYTQIIFVM